MDLSYVMGNSLLSYLTLLGQAFMNAGLRWRYLSIWSFWGPEFLRREAHVELTCIHFVQLGLLSCILKLISTTDKNLGLCCTL